MTFITYEVKFAFLSKLFNNLPASSGAKAAPAFSMKYWIESAVLRTSGKVMS